MYYGENKKIYKKEKRVIYTLLH